jgi:ABC-type nitrate/sulfonate/bicarbonate transport system substrate-binding protein
LVSPILEQSIETGKIRVLANAKDSIGKHYLNSAWFTTADYAAAHPDVIQKFALVMRTASTFANANHAATVDLIAAFTNVDPATVARSTRPMWGDRIGKGDLQPLVEAAAKYHAIDKSFDATQLVSPMALQVFR